MDSTVARNTAGQNNGVSGATPDGGVPRVALSIPHAATSGVGWHYTQRTNKARVSVVWLIEKVRAVWVT